MLVDVSYAAPQAHRILNAALHREYSLGIVFIFSQGGRIFIMSKTKKGVTPMSTTRLYRGYINWG
jgi:hypothetical protein